MLKCIVNSATDFLLGVVFLQKHARLLSTEERTLLASYFAENTLNAVRICENRVPFWLHKNMAGVVLGCHVYFRPQAYLPEQQASIELLAHEITHVEQYLAGMNILKYLWQSRRGYHQNPYEIEAYAKGIFVRERLSLKCA